ELDTGERTVRLRVGDIGLAPDRAIEALREDPEVYDLEDGPDLKRVVPHATAPAPPLFYFMDLPLLRDEDAASAHAPRAAAYGSPWQPVAVYRASSSSASLKRDSTVDLGATIGVLAESLFSGPVSRWDEVSTLTVEVGAGIALASAEEIDILNGAN